MGNTDGKILNVMVKNAKEDDYNSIYNSYTTATIAAVAARSANSVSNTSLNVKNTVFILNSGGVAEESLKKDSLLSISAVYVNRLFEYNDNPNVIKPSFNNISTTLDGVTIKTTDGSHPDGVEVSAMNIADLYPHPPTQVDTGYTAKNINLDIINSDLHANRIVGIGSYYAAPYNVRSFADDVYVNIQKSTIKLYTPEGALNDYANGNIYAVESASHINNANLNITNSDINLSNGHRQDGSYVFSISTVASSTASSSANKLNIANTKIAFEDEKSSLYMRSLYSSMYDIESTGPDEKYLYENNAVVLDNVNLTTTFDDNSFILYGAQITGSGRSYDENKPNIYNVWVNNTQVNLNYFNTNVYSTITGTSIKEATYSTHNIIANYTVDNSEVNIANSTFDNSAYITSLRLTATQASSGDNSYDYTRGQIKASNNTLNISNTTFNSKDSLLSTVWINALTAQDKEHSYSNNTITLENVKFGGYGIYAVMNGYYDEKGNWVGNKGRAENNTVTIGQNVTGADGEILHLKYLYAARGAVDYMNFKGNTLELKSKVIADNFGGFQHFKFFVDGNDKSGEPMLTVNNGPMHIHIGDKISQLPDSDSTITIFTKNIENLKEGETYKLIHNSNGITNHDGSKITDEELNSIKNTQEWIVNYRSLAAIDKIKSADIDLTILDESGNGKDDTIAIGGINKGSITTPEENPINGSFMKNSLSRLTTIYASDDLLIDTIEKNKQLKQNVFIASRVNDLCYNTGSHVSDNTVSTLLGISSDFSEIFTVGIFGEFGYNDYNTYNDTIIGNVLGNGNSKYYGGGIYATYNNDNGFYLDGFLKGGAINTDFEVNNDIAGKFNHDTNHHYLGINVSAGYKFNISNTLSLNASLRYFYDYISSNKASVIENNANLTTTKYDAIKAHKVQPLLKLQNNFTIFNPYVGVGIDYIFGSNADGTTSDFVTIMNISDKDINGFSGIVLIGSDMNIDDSLLLNVDIKGYIGNIKGLAGSLNIKYIF